LPFKNKQIPIRVFIMPEFVSSLDMLNGFWLLFLNNLIQILRERGRRLSRVLYLICYKIIWISSRFGIWDMTLSLLPVNRRFGGIYRLGLQDRMSSKAKDHHKAGSKLCERSKRNVNPEFQLISFGTYGFIPHKYVFSELGFTWFSSASPYEFSEYVFKKALHVWLLMQLLKNHILTFDDRTKYAVESDMLINTLRVHWLTQTSMDIS
jgi:hypothetical protein